MEARWSRISVSRWRSAARSDSRAARAACAAAAAGAASAASAGSRVASAWAACHALGLLGQLRLQRRQLGQQGGALLGQRALAFVGDGQLAGQRFALGVQLGGGLALGIEQLAHLGEARPQRGDFLIIVFLAA